MNNQGPPVFSESLPLILVEVGTTREYLLPKVTTPNNDLYNITVDLQDSLTFISYSSSDKFSISP